VSSQSFSITRLSRNPAFTNAKDRCNQPSRSADFAGSWVVHPCFGHTSLILLIQVMPNLFTVLPLLDHYYTPSRQSTRGLIRIEQGRLLCNGTSDLSIHLALSCHGTVFEPFGTVRIPGRSFSPTVLSYSSLSIYFLRSRYYHPSFAPAPSTLARSARRQRVVQRLLL